MHIVVKLFATFRSGRFAEQARICPENLTAGGLLAELGIPEGDVGVLLKNGRHCQAQASLSEGDIISIFPLLGGG